jgi:hypothetical protein
MYIRLLKKCTFVYTQILAIVFKILFQNRQHLSLTLRHAYPLFKPLHTRQLRDAHLLLGGSLNKGCFIILTIRFSKYLKKMFQILRV